MGEQERGEVVEREGALEAVGGRVPVGPVAAEVVVQDVEGFYKHFPAKDELVRLPGQVDGIWTGQLRGRPQAGSARLAAQPSRLLAP